MSDSDWIDMPEGNKTEGNTQTTPEVDGPTHRSTRRASPNLPPLDPNDDWVYAEEPNTVSSETTEHDTLVLANGALRDPAAFIASRAALLDQAILTEDQDGFIRILDQALCDINCSAQGVKKIYEQIQYDESKRQILTSLQKWCRVPTNSLIDSITDGGTREEKVLIITARLSTAINQLNL